MVMMEVMEDDGDDNNGVAPMMVQVQALAVV